MDLTADLTVGAAMRPHPRETVSGDAWAMVSRGERHYLALADGAGHGELAAQAAQAAIAIVEREAGRALPEVFAICHQALRPTRGAVMTVAVIDVGEGTVELAGVGNVEARLLLRGSETHPLIQRGMLGANLPTVRPLKFEVGESWALALHSDGVRSRWSLAEATAREGAARSVQEMTDELLASQARGDDDATLVVAMPRDGARSGGERA